MTDHVHFDLAAAEATMRANIAQTVIGRHAMAEKNPADATFLAAQAEFDEARVQFALACMRSENAGLGRNETLSAAGYAIGSMWVNGLQGALGARERSIVNGWVQQAMIGAFGLETTEKTINSVFKPLEAGNA